MPSALTEAISTKSRRWIFGTMLAFGIIGLSASFVLSNEKIHTLENPDAVLSCTLNIVLDCSVVMKTWQAKAFGFTNSFIGLMGYSVVIGAAVVGLTGARLPRWFWRTALICYFLGLVFAYWLFFQSVYVIEVLCIWCLIVTFATTLVFGAMERFSLRNNLLNLPAPIDTRVQRFLDKGFDKLVLASWLLLMFLLVLMKFGDGLFL